MSFLKVERMKNKGYALTSLDEKGKNLVKKYKNKYLKDDKNPFHAYRVSSETRLTIKENTKRFVAIDRSLAEEAESINGDTIKNIVEHLLRCHISGVSVQRALDTATSHTTKGNSERHPVEELAWVWSTSIVLSFWLLSY